MVSWEPDEIDFEDQYNKLDPIDDRCRSRHIYE